mmetsp:Transcript_3728/g.6835  ORF Transcript_3728/g.6835 Transcript_3728/m.6835 type:complete len:311 (+) Transcript_3728:1763-2695(+)
MRLITMNCTTQDDHLANSKNQGMLIDNAPHQLISYCTTIYNLFGIQSQQQIGPTATTVSTTCIRQIHNVAAVGKFSGNFLGRIDTTNFDNGVSGLFHGLGNNGSSLGFSLSTRHHGLTFLFGFFDDPLLAFRLLRCHLFCLDGVHELPSKGQVGDGDVVKLQVEGLGPFHHFNFDPLGDLVTLAEEFFGVVLRHDALEDFVANGRQDTLIEIGAEFPVDPWQLVDNGPPQHTKLDVNHLQILRSCDGRDLAGFCPNIKDGWALDDWNQKVGSLSGNIWQNSTPELIEHDGSFATVHIVDALGDGEGAGSG